MRARTIVHAQRAFRGGGRPLKLIVRSPLMYFVRLLALGFVSGATVAATPVNHSLAAQFDRARTVILVQVQESTFPKAYSSFKDELSSHDASAVLLVIRSWKGSHHAGTTIRAIQPQFCGGYPCHNYPFQVGETLLVYDSEWGESLENLHVETADARTMTDLYLLSWGGGPNQRLERP